MSASTVVFLKALENALDVNGVELTLETEFQSLDSWDSLALISVISWVDEQYGVELSPNEILKCTTLGELYLLTSQNSKS